MPFVWGTPEWVAPQAIDLPVRSVLAALGLDQAAARSGRTATGPTARSGTNNPKLPFLPIRRWEIWNEENIVTFADAADPAGFATLIRISGRVLHRRRPRRQGDPRRLLRAAAAGAAQRRLRRLPLAPLPGAQRQALLRRRRPAPLRRRRPGDGRAARKPAADHARPRRRRDADLRDRAGLGLAQRPDPLGARPLRARRTSSRRPSRCSPPTACSWRVGGAWWFTWTDEGGSCLFCRSAGLLTEKREAKPAWYRFNAWTGGDAGHRAAGAASARRRGTRRRSRSRSRREAPTRRPRGIAVARLRTQLRTRPEESPDAFLRSRSSLRLRRARAAHRRGDDARPPRQASPGLRRQSQRRPRGHRVGRPRRRGRAARTSPACPPTSRARSATTPAATTTTRSSGRC